MAERQEDALDNARAAFRAKNYSGALEQYEYEALGLLVQTRNPERFHDYVAICEYLKRTEDPIRKFLELHYSDRKLASSIVRFVWDQLVQEKQWSVCGTHLPEPHKSYAAAVVKFDQAMGLCKSDPSLGGEEFEEQIQGWYVRDVANLLLVLKNTHREPDAAAIQACMDSDMNSRGRTGLIGRVHERVDL